MDRTSVPTTARQLPGRHRGPTTSDGAARSMKSGTCESSRVRGAWSTCRSSDSLIRAVDRRPIRCRIPDIAGLGSGTHLRNAVRHFLNHETASRHPRASAGLEGFRITRPKASTGRRGPADRSAAIPLESVARGGGIGPCRRGAGNRRRRGPGRGSGAPRSDRPRSA